MEMKQIELKELIREVLLTEFQGDKEIESQINAYGKLKDKKINIVFFPTLSRPAFSVEAAVLDGFGQVLYSDVLALGNIRNGAGYFQDAVVGTRRES